MHQKAFVWQVTGPPIKEKEMGNLLY